MADNVNGIWKLADVLKTMTASGNGSKVISRVREVDSEGNVWVVPAGSDEAFPVSYTTADVSPGDTVVVTIENGRASVDGSTSAPSISAAKANELLQPIAESASTARAMAGAAAAAAESAQESADQAAGAASSAQQSADQAATAASIADGKAVQAAAAAAVADGKAVAAGIAADAAQGAADSALVQLATVEDVMGTATWIAEHGTYELTEDTEVDDSKVYYERTGSGTQADPYVYTAVAEPTDEGLPTYYELHVEQAVSQYVASHLALTDAGLYVLKDSSGYRLLCSNTGVSVIDPQGHVVATYGTTIDFASDRDWHMGSQDAYIAYDASEGTITIGGSSINLGDSRTLSELLGEVDATLRFDVTETYSSDHASVTLTAHVYKGDEDIAQTFPENSFSWSLKNEDHPEGEPIGTGNGYYVTVSRAAAGYGAVVCAKFTPPNDATALTGGDDTLTTSDDDPLSVRWPSGDYVRVSELDVETTVFDTDKLLVIGAEDEHLVTVETLKGVFGTPSYTNITDKPSIEGVTLVGDKSFPELGIFLDADIPSSGQGGQYPASDDYAMDNADILAIFQMAMAS